MTDHTVVLHRTPRPRIDLNPVRKRPEDVTEMDFSYSPAECDRIWGLIRQSAEGCNATTETVE
jgi:hypothetical protein